ncbi:MAG: hypothetical protein QF573_03575 [Chloroflexota bacterium]|nr:hypothetical protein [Chloroflexota bacterium]
MPRGVLGARGRWWVVVLLGLALGLAACGSDEPPPLTPDVVLLEIELGSAMLDRAEDEDEGAVEVTGIVELEEGDQLAIGAEARAYFVNGAGHALLLTGGTDLGFERFFKVAGAVMREIVVDQRSGAILYSIPELPNGVFFQVRAGRTTIMVQRTATELAAVVDGPSDQRVKVFSGEVDVLLRRPDLTVGELHAVAGDVVLSRGDVALELGDAGEVLPDEATLLADLRARAAGIEKLEASVVTPTIGLDLPHATPTPQGPDRPAAPSGDETEGPAVDIGPGVPGVEAPGGELAGVDAPDAVATPAAAD